MKYSKVEVELRQCAAGVWDIIGSDVDAARRECGLRGRIPAEEIADVVVDHFENQPPYHDLSPEAKEHWKKMDFTAKLILVAKLNMGL